MIQRGTGHRVVEAFLAGDAPAMIDLLAPDATFHSPVTSYQGRERLTELLTAVLKVVTAPTLTRVLEGPAETAAFFTAEMPNGRRAECVLLVLAAEDAPATDVTLMIRPLKSLLAGIDRMKELLGIP